MKAEGPCDGKHCPRPMPTWTHSPRPTPTWTHTPEPTHSPRPTQHPAPDHSGHHGGHLANTGSGTSLLVDGAGVAALGVLLKVALGVPSRRVRSRG